MNINGLISVWKPSGCYSGDILSFIKNTIVSDYNKRNNTNYRTFSRNFNVHLVSEDAKRKSLSKQKYEKFPRDVKIGHGGTLDPLAEGVLVIGLGSATKKLNHYLNQSRKVYEATGIFGKTTDSYDTTGTVTKTFDISQEKKTELLNKTALTELLLDKFKGSIVQTPPVYSAIRINGERMYDLARKAKTEGKTIEMSESKKRTVTIYDIELLDLCSVSDKNDDDCGAVQFKIRVSVSGGTYIRSIVHDIGTELGVGACMSALTRVSQAEFSRDADNLELKPITELNDLINIEFIKSKLVTEESHQTNAVAGIKRKLI